MLTHRRRLHSFLAAVAVLAVCLVAWAVFHGKPAKASKPQAVPVSVATAAVADVPVTVNVLGSAQAWTSDTIVAQVSGLLRSVYFVEGTDVRAGQLLAQIDPAPFRAALTQAQGTLRRDRALLAGARVDLARYQTLTQQDSIARQTFDDQTALVHQDEGVVQLDEGIVENAQINLRWCRITSPITGRTGVRSVDPGNFVAPSAGTGTTSAATGATTGPIGIVIVNQIDPIAVTFSVPQGAYQRLRDVSNGFRIPLVTRAFSQETNALLGTGELSIADNRVLAATGTVAMKARFDNAGERLLPGQFVNVQLTLQTLSHATTIPTTAVNQGPNGPFAYVVGADQKVSIRPLKVGATEGATAVITAGVQPGETVVTDGQTSLDAGSIVRISQRTLTPAAPP